MKTFIIEVHQFDGDDTQIEVTNNSGIGDEKTIYCVGQLGPDKVVRFIDEGYRTVAEAKAAWPEALT